jgi:hypothetical protein
MHEPSVRRKGDGLLLHGGVDDDLGEVGRLRRTGSGRDRKALLNEGRELLLAHALTPARQRRAVEGELVLEKLLAAKELEIGVLQPTIAQCLVGEIMRVLQDRQARHEPRRQGWASHNVGVDRPEALLQKAPVDGAGELGEWMP